jgi:predicted dehydrogenase
LKQLRTGVVGLGFIGRQHIDALRRLPYARLTGVCDQDENASQAVSAQWGIPAFHDWKAMIDSGEIDAVHNCTPNSLHDEINEYAIAKRLHVYSEKPLSVTAEGALRLQRNAEAAGVCAAVNYNYRHNAMAHEMRARLCDAGRPLIVRGEYLQDWLLKDTDFNWRVETRDGQSRAVADIGTHWMDLAEWMLGQPIVALRASLGVAHPTRVAPGGQRVPVRTEDFGFLELKFRGGVPGILILSQVSAGHKNGLGIAIDCEEASLEWHQEEADRLRISRRGGIETLYADPAILCGNARPLATLPAGHAVAWADALRNAIGLFYQSILSGSFHEGKVDFATFADGARQMRLIEAALQSNKSGQWVEPIL